MTVRVVAAGRTAPNAALRFGGERGDLDVTGRRDCARLSAAMDFSPNVGGDHFCGPEASAVQTADALGIAVRIDPGLRSLDIGAWQDSLPQQIPVEQLGAWFADVTATPHGGESIADLVARVGSWCDVHIGSATHVGSAAAETVTVVAAMPVVAAIIAHTEHGGPDEFWSIEVAPGSVRDLSPSDDRWWPGRAAL